MPGFEQDLLQVATYLLHGPGSSSAYARRSVSTSYYALFHFLLAEVAIRVSGAGSGQQRRGRLLGRTISHAAMRAALARVEADTISPRAIFDFLRSASVELGTVATPDFMREMAGTFADAQAMRHDADYDLEANLSVAVARQLHARVASAIDAWSKATTRADEDLKDGVCLLVLLGGKLRNQSG